MVLQAVANFIWERKLPLCVAALLFLTVSKLPPLVPPRREEEELPSCEELTCFEARAKALARAVRAGRRDGARAILMQAQDQAERRAMLARCARAGALQQGVAQERAQLPQSCKAAPRSWLPWS